MLRALLRTKARLRDALKPSADKAIGALSVGALRTARRFDSNKTASVFGHIAQRAGRFTREDAVGRGNLKAAFPEKSDAEIEAILSGVWNNLGRVAAEFAQLDRIWQYDPQRPDASRIETTPRSMALFEQLRNDGKPALIFASHLGNWELPALAAVAHGLDTTVLYRPPNVAAVDRAVREIRAVNMGTMIPGSLDAPLKLAHALNEGQHVAMLVDQHFGNGVDVTFFGRKAKTNPLLARLLRQVECPIHGTRIVRLPGNRFRAELSEEVKPVRDVRGRIDIQGTMQAVTDVVEGWVREHPEQWLWLHRRWR